MAEISDAAWAEFERLVDESAELIQKDELGQALTRYQAAWELLPEPRFDCEEAFWLLRDIGDLQFRLGQHADGRRTLMTAMKFVGDALGDPFIRMRLGQCMFELGEEGAAADWLTTAYLLEGLKLFRTEHPKYIAFVKSLLEPPPGGWPEGW